jgi:hypothetical protein
MSKGIGAEISSVPLILKEAAMLSSPYLRTSRVAAAAALLSMSAGLLAQPNEAASASPTANTTNPVIAVVKVPSPWYAPRALVVGKMRETVPQYQSTPGLLFKAFSFAQADAQFGGIYLWQTRSGAEEWFGPAWHERVRKERGVEGKVRLFDAPLTIDNTPGGTPFEGSIEAVATIVTLPIPAGLSRERLVAEFKASVPTYQKIDGLLRKSFIITADGQFGGVYLWRNLAAAQQWFSPAWHERVRTRYANAAQIEWFDTPILLPSKLAGNVLASGPTAAQAQPKSDAQ